MGFEKIWRKIKEIKCINEQTVHEILINGLVKYDATKYDVKDDGDVILVDDDTTIVKFVW